MDADSAPPTGVRAAALIAWGMGLLGAGMALLVLNLLRSDSPESTASLRVALVVVGVGWVLLTAGVTRLARRLDQLGDRREDLAVPTP